MIEEHMILALKIGIITTIAMNHPTNLG